jgi:hypothetical protein
MSLRFGSGWLVIYFLICSCTFICSAPRCAHEIIRRLILLPLARAGRTVRSLDREGAPQAVVAWGLFRIPKGLKCVECREAGRGAGVHAPQAEFTFRTYCPYGSNRQNGYPKSSASSIGLRSGTLATIAWHISNSHPALTVAGATRIEHHRGTCGGRDAADFFCSALPAHIARPIPHRPSRFSRPAFFCRSFFSAITQACLATTSVQLSERKNGLQKHGADQVASP